MALGYMIRMGDKTTCGGQVLDGHRRFIIEGMPRAREGDPVSCGVTGQVYQIVGGVETFTDDGRLVAGNLDSVSSCPCRAGLLPSCNFSYQSSKGLGASGAGRTASSAAPSAARQGYTSGSACQTSAASAAMADSTPRTDTEIAEPGFYIVPNSMSRSALEAALFDKPSLETLAMFRALNPGQGSIKGGSMIILSDPRNQTCTREEALLMEAAATVNEALKPLSDEEADFMVRHYGEISTFLAHSAAAVGVGEAMFSRNLNNVKTSLENVQKLHWDAFARDGKLNSTQFLAERARVLADLDINLSPLTRKAIGFPVHPKLKTALGLSSRSLVHHWRKAGVGPIPGYATHIERVSRTAKIVQAAGWVGIPISGGASYLKVKDVCMAGSEQACTKVKYTEAGGFSVGTAAGIATGYVMAKGAAAAICVALGVPTVGVAPIACGIIAVGAASFAAGASGSLGGAAIGELIYEATQ
ncbi:PAAR domain-containing protein [Pseudomonas japonica]|uniref:PAAR domain-containing protein n=1 Tax=Pseudomonas japonica TaxID=256466 RepID=UPI00381B1891